MALKAGRVGVAPSEVDAFGHIIGGDVPINVLTTADVIDALNQRERSKPLSANQGVELNGRLGNVESKLKIPNEDERFFFAKENNKYGFRLTQNGDFHPFSSGVEESGLYLLNSTPFESVSDKVTLEQGGYEIISGELGVIIVKGITNAELSHGETIISFNASISNVSDYKILSSNNKFTFNSEGLGSIRANGTVAKDTEILIYGLYRRV